MADVDIDPFGEHESRLEEPTDEHSPLDLVTPGRSSTWEPDQGEQETSFGGEYQKKLVKPQNYFTMIILNSKVGNYTT